MLRLDVMTAFSDDDTFTPPVVLEDDHHRHARAYWEHTRGKSESLHFEQFVAQLKVENELACGHVHVSYEYHSTVVIPLSAMMTYKTCRN